MAVAAATAALCCSTVPPASRTRILFRLAIGQPEALKNKQRDMPFWTETNQDQGLPTFCGRGTCRWNGRNHRILEWDSEGVPNPDHRVACSSACWLLDSLRGCDVRSSCPSRVQSHRIRVLGTWAPASVIADDCGPSASSPSIWQKEEGKGRRISEWPKTLNLDLKTGQLLVLR